MGCARSSLVVRAAPAPAATQPCPGHRRRCLSSRSCCSSEAAQQTWPPSPPPALSALASLQTAQVLVSHLSASGSGLHTSRPDCRFSLVAVRRSICHRTQQATGLVLRGPSSVHLFQARSIPMVTALASHAVLLFHVADSLPLSDGRLCLSHTVVAGRQICSIPWSRYCQNV